MKSLSLSKYLYIILIFFFNLNLLAEEPIDIWKKKQSSNENKKTLKLSNSILTRQNGLRNKLFYAAYNALLDDCISHPGVVG